MGTRPQTMCGLNDSPVFLAAYMLDHDPTSYATLIAPAFLDGDEGGLTRDDILDNITMFWLTNTGSRPRSRTGSTWGTVASPTSGTSPSRWP